MAEISKQALLVDNNQSFPDNNAGAITPVDLRSFNIDLIDSTVNQAVYTTNSGSWNNTISQLNAFTASQQPSFTALNTFTASQLTINTGINQFTQSTTGRLNALETETANLELFTSSINQILVNGVSIGTSTRLFFNGFVSASIIPNVGGAIASINVLSDPSLTPTASFNQYTASTAATQSVFSASVATSISQSSNAFNTFSASQNSFNLSATASISQLLSFSASLDTTYATDAQLNSVSSSLMDQLNSVSSSLMDSINTKLNTSSFNDYSQSVSSSLATSNSKINVLSSFTGSYATTGSNVFTGTQIISGSDNASATFSKNSNFINTTKVTTQLDASAQVYANTSSIAGVYVGVFDDPNFNTDVEHAIEARATGISFSDWDNGTTFGFVPYMTIAPNNGDNPAPVFTRGLDITGSTTITGSVYGNIVSMSIASQTASMDLRVGNFFTLTLVSGSTTHLTATNIRPGQTVNLLINQPSVGTGSVSYNTTFDFPAGANYIATPVTSSKDILSLITFDSSILYATSINNLA